MSRRTLEQWLEYQQQLHHAEIELGLGRIASVWKKLHPDPIDATVITVSGTNGKGSTVAYLEAILIAAGYSVGAYTSPHLVRYNERMRINGQDATDDAICAVFEQIEDARDDIPLTYFEFGTLAALLLFEMEDVNVMVLEVGLGGRLDATNLVDADGVIVTSIGLDHLDWLGSDINQIAREKAGIMRPAKPAVIAQANTPSSLFEHAIEIGAQLIVSGKDYHINHTPHSWSWRSASIRYNNLPVPQLPGSHQLDNAAAAIALLQNMSLQVDEASIHTGLSNARVQARFQVLQYAPRVVLDVAHNREAAEVLSQTLASNHDVHRWVAVMSMFADKPIGAVVAELDEQVDAWYIYPLASARAISLDELEKRMLAAGIHGSVHREADFDQAYQQAYAMLGEHDGLIIFGSFEVAGEAIEKLLH